MKSEEPSHWLIAGIKKSATLAKWYESLSNINYWHFSRFPDSLQESFYESRVLLSGRSQHLNLDDLMFGASFRHFRHMFVT